MPNEQMREAVQSMREAAACPDCGGVTMIKGKKTKKKQSLAAQILAIRDTVRYATIQGHDRNCSVLLDGEYGHCTCKKRKKKEKIND